MKTNSLYDIEYYEKINQEIRNKNRRKAKRRIAFLFIILLVVLYIVSPYSKINKIEVEGNVIYSDQEIIAMTSLQKNQLIITKPVFLIKDKIQTTNKFTSFDVKKDYFKGVITISVSENKIIYTYVDEGINYFVDEHKNVIKISDDKINQFKADIPLLNTKIEEKLQGKLASVLSKLDSSFYLQISQITYLPKEYDNEFFSFTMVGPAKVYLDMSLDDLTKIQNGYENIKNREKSACFHIQYVEKAGANSSALVLTCN